MKSIKTNKTFDKGKVDSNSKSSSLGKGKKFGENKIEGMRGLKITKLSSFTRILLGLLRASFYTVPAFELVSRISSLHKRNGATFMVLYLKESHRLIMKALAGTPERCITFPRVATRRGFPLIVPGSLRLGMEHKDTMAIKLTQTLVCIYRVTKIESFIKTNPITDPFTGSSMELPEYEIKFALERLGFLKHFHIDPKADLIISTKAGPNRPNASLGMTFDAGGLSISEGLLESFSILSKTLGSSVLKLLMEEISILPKWKSQITDAAGGRLLCPSHSHFILGPYGYEPILGRLCEKLEAAGKIRLFAITDIGTQSLLRVLHDALFRVLRFVKMDGTFDQIQPLYRLMEEGHSEFYSFDLSSATDRLPIALQKQILGILVNKEFAYHGANLLVGRPWYLDDVPYIYSVGQPMGALSSGAMLATTHHVIVQIAAMRVGGRRRFTHYAVLGDDLVIADSQVATSYLEICKILGVEINLHKSLMSKVGVAEFAKRLISNSQDISPIPPKLVVSLLKGLQNLPQVIRDMLNRGLSVETFFEKRLDSPDCKIRVSNAILWNCIGPLGFLPSVGLSPFQGNRSLTPSELHDVVEAVMRVVNRSIQHGFYTQQQETQVLVDRIGTLVGDGLIPDDKSGSYHSTGMSDDTPAFHYLMNLLIEKVIEGNTTQPEMVKGPKDQEFTFTSIYLFMQDTAEYLDTLEPIIPDLLDSGLKSSPRSTAKLKFYRELEEELLLLSIR